MFLCECLVVFVSVSLFSSSNFLFPFLCVFFLRLHFNFFDIISFLPSVYTCLTVRSIDLCEEIWFHILFSFFSSFVRYFSQYIYMYSSSSQIWYILFTFPCMWCARVCELFNTNVTNPTQRYHMKIIPKRFAALLHGFVFISSTNTTKRMSKQQRQAENKIAKIWNQEHPRKKNFAKK